MFLDRLEIQGFKSFANKTIIDFSATRTKTSRGKITAIIGPNGSGKSNIADAIRWVFGEQKIKSLRGKKTEDIIFGGSDTRPRSGMTQVTIALSNDGDTLPIELKNIEITRRLDRGGEGEYLLNRKKVRLLDIELLLAKAHFGQKTYSVISQGMIDSLLTAVPEERKKFFDEAAGIKEFQIKRDLATNKLELTLTNLKEIKMLIEEIEPRLSSLTRQVNRLKRRTEIETKLREKLYQYYGILWHDYTVSLEKLSSLRFALIEKKKIVQKTQKEIEIQLQLLEKEEIDPSVLSLPIQKIYQSLLEEKTNFREQEITLRHKIEMEQHMKERMPSIKSLSEIIDDLDAFTESLILIIKKTASLNQPDQWKTCTNEFQVIVDDLKNYIKNLKQPKKPEITPPSPVLTKELEKITLTISKLNKNIEETGQKINLLQEENKKNRGKFFDLQRNFQNQQNELNKLIREENEISIEITRLSTRREDLEHELNEENILLKDIESKIPKKENTENIFSEIRSMKHQLELIGGIDPETMKEYEETKERYEFLSNQTSDLEKAMNDLVTIIEEMDTTIREAFQISFQSIQEHFKKYFKTLFRGGEAELILQKENETPVKELLEEKGIGKKKNNVLGIEISAKPPGKKIKNIQMLSGGEKALTSIALLCAIIATKASPFIVLDEVDAPLDESNALRFGEILEELSEKTQFIIITHNRISMERAGLLYGVTMNTDGVSRLLSVKLENKTISKTTSSS